MSRSNLISLSRRTNTTKRSVGYYNGLKWFRFETSSVIIWRSIHGLTRNLHLNSNNNNNSIADCTEVRIITFRQYSK